MRNARASSTAVGLAAGGGPFCFDGGGGGGGTVPFLGCNSS
jgi:hypothetical protein